MKATRVVMLNVIMLNVVMLSVVMLSVVMLNVVMLSVVYGGCRVFCSADFGDARSNYAQCGYAEWHCDMCRLDECRGALTRQHVLVRLSDPPSLEEKILGQHSQIILRTS
jgi:hypothetical protein